jgi:hypothetical protein
MYHSVHIVLHSRNTNKQPTSKTHELLVYNLKHLYSLALYLQFQAPTITPTDMPTKSVEQWVPPLFVVEDFETILTAVTVTESEVLTASFPLTPAPTIAPTVEAGNGYTWEKQVVPVMFVEVSDSLSDVALPCLIASSQFISRHPHA